MRPFLDFKLEKRTLGIYMPIFWKSLLQASLNYVDDGEKDLFLEIFLLFIKDKGQYPREFLFYYFLFGVVFHFADSHHTFSYPSLRY